jgi:hypothetical protein
MWSFLVGAAESIGYAAQTGGVAGCRDRKAIVGRVTVKPLKCVLSRTRYVRYPIGCRISGSFGNPRRQDKISLTTETGF